MKNFADRKKLEAAEEQKFIERCKEEFVETSLASSNRKKVGQLTAASYLPNVFSAITAGFFVFYLLSGYTRTIALILGFLLLSIVIAVEAGKRGIIATLAKEYFIDGKTPVLAIVGLLACFALSMTASYIGGQQLVVETAPPPPREANPQIDSLNQVLAAQQATIERLQRTTWKGKVTRNAQAGINEAKKLQNQIYSRIATLEAQDDETHTATLLKHNTKHLNFGIVLGVLAALADWFLLGLLWTAKKLKYQVAAANYQATQAQAGGTGSGTAAQASYQLPSISNGKTGLNQQPRPIGFRQAKKPAPNATVKEPPGDEGEKAVNSRADATVNNATVKEALEPGEKRCENCGNVFHYKVTWQKFCCQDCKREFHAQKHGGKPFSPKRYHKKNGND